MNVIIQQTNELYRDMYRLPVSERMTYFKEQITKPYDQMLQMMGMIPDPNMMNCLPLNSEEATVDQMLNELEAINAWGQAQEAIDDCIKAFEYSDLDLPEQVTVGLFLGNPDTLAGSKGYTGMGSIPGYIIIVIAPNAYNLPKLKACIAHEFHHNVLFNNTDWDFMREVTVARYLAVEGLAENFAASLYGTSAVGPWVTGVSKADVKRSKTIIHEHLSETGFMQVSPYIFGDNPFMPDAPQTGIPYCGGYAVGFFAVKSYLETTGKTVAEATAVDGNEMMAKSGYFV